MLEWYMARIVVKNGHQKSMCYNGIELCAQNINIMLDSIVYTNWERSMRSCLWTLISFSC